MARCWRSPAKRIGCTRYWHPADVAGSSPSQKTTNCTIMVQSETVTLESAMGARRRKDGLADEIAPVRIAVVTPVPTPYRDPFWSEVERLRGVDLTVFYCAPGKLDRPWKSTWRRDYAYQVLPGWNLARFRGSDASCFWNPGICGRLSSGRFDGLVVDGYNHLTMWAAIAFGLRRNLPFFL